MVPKRIFQTWKTREVPPEWAAAQASVIKMNPNWEYVLLTDEDNERIVQEHFPDFHPHYMAFPHPIQRADAIRYCIMYLYGGVYLDLDYVALKPFDDLVLEKDIGLIHSNNNVLQRRVTNSFLVSAAPGHPFWRACIEEMKKGAPWYAVTKHLEVFLSTGPFMLDRVYQQNKDAVHILKNVSVSCDVCQVGQCKNDTSYYVKPITGNSWHSWDSTAMNAVYCKLDVLLFLVFLGITKFR